MPAASFEERIDALFRSPVDERITLSPDGQRLAYASHHGRSVSIVIMNLEHAVPKRTVRVEPTVDSLGGDEPAPAGLRFLRWATDTRLVFARTERVVPLPPVTLGNGQIAPNPSGPTIISPIETVDVDGKERGTLVDARDFMDTPADARKTLADLLRTPQELVRNREEPAAWRMPHLDIVGFLPQDREQLIIQTRGSYSMPAQHLVDIRTGTVREYGGEWLPLPNDTEVFDGFRHHVVGTRPAAAYPVTHWRDLELAGVQREVEAKFPSRRVEILDWSATRERVLFRVTGGDDPGRLFVFQRPEDVVLEVLRRTSWLDAATLGRSLFFEFSTSDGARLSGYVTLPRKPRAVPTPVVLVFPSRFPGGAQRAFDPEGQVWADRGFAVVRLNHRSVAGVRKDDLVALRAGVDRVSVADARALLEHITAQAPDLRLDAARVVALGHGFGGYLALRALQLHPNHFRGGVAIEAPLDVRSWIRSPAAVVGPREGDSEPAVPPKVFEAVGVDWKKMSVLEQAETLTKPVLLLAEPTRQPAIDSAARALRSRLEKGGRAAEYVILDDGFAAGRLAARVSVYQKIGDFLDRQLAGEIDEAKGGGKQEP